VAAVKIVKRLTGICLCKLAIVPEELTDMWIWVDGGQAEYVMVPYADFNLLKFLTKIKPWKDIRSNYAD
jgi:threonine dehydrogenase-like Zn-dependent dehydrogenase